MKENSTKNRTLAIPLIVAIVAGALGFFGGMKYQQTKIISDRFPGAPLADGAGRQGRFGGGGGGQMMMRGGFRPVSGEIIDADDTSVTVKMDDGSSRIVFLSAKTLINKADTVSASELTKGQRVVVFGESNSDGSVNAQSIQLNPTQMRMMRGGSTPSATAVPAQ